MEELSRVIASPVGLVAAALFGAVWGSFLNVCIARVPRGESVVRPGSHCFACGRPVRALDNLPIISWFLLRGRCRDCHAPFSFRYPAVEALTALLSALTFWKFTGDVPPSALGMALSRYVIVFAFLAVLLVLSFIDYDTKLLPDVITLPGILLFFLAGFATDFAPWHERLIGVVAGYLVVWLIAEIYFRLRHREGLGLGDGKLLSMVCALCGWKALPVALFIGSLVGVLVSVPLLLLIGRAGAEARPAGDETPLRQVEIPFGGYLAFGAALYALAGDLIARELAVRGMVL